MVKGGWRNSRKRRDRPYIIAEILEVVKYGALKTQIMNKANLSFAQINEYLSLLLEVKLIEAILNNEKSIYKTTPKGLQYLQRCKEILALLSKEGFCNPKSGNPPICSIKSSVRWFQEMGYAPPERPKPYRSI